MLTQSDKNYLEKHFVTIELFSETMSFIATKQELAKMNAKINASHTELVGMLSEVLAQLQSIQENTTVSDYRQSEHSNQLENHEQRIGKVEHKLAINI